MLSLAEVAKSIGAELVVRLNGEQPSTEQALDNGTVRVDSIADIHLATASQLSFITGAEYLQYLDTSEAAAIITSPNIAADRSGIFLLMDNPYLGYARAAQLFDTTPKLPILIHETSVIDETVKLGDAVSIGPQVSIESGCVIGDGVSIGAGCHLGKNVKIGAHSRLWSGVNIYHNVQLGDHAILHSGCTIGSDGFGFANDAGQWVKIPQLGSVVIGDYFEAGANTSIDRGALNNTQIGNCVKLDNLVHIAHNVEIGDRTAIAGMTGVAGGTKIGKACTIAGRVSIIGHLELCDNVHITVATLITKSITEPGVYSSGDVALSNKDWKRKTVRLKQLDALFGKVKQVEKDLKNIKQDKN